MTWNGQLLKDMGERVVTTFVVTFATLFFVQGQADMDASQVALTGAVAAALSLAKNILATIIGIENGGTWWQDMLERAGTTYVQVWIGLVIVNETTDFSDWKPAALAAIPTALNVIKGALAAHFGDPDTAGFLTANNKVPYVPEHAAPADPEAG